MSDVITVGDNKIVLLMKIVILTIRIIIRNVCNKKKRNVWVKLKCSFVWVTNSCEFSSVVNDFKMLYFNNTCLHDLILHVW